MQFDYTLFLWYSHRIGLCFHKYTISELYKIEMIASVNIKSKKNSELQNEMHKSLNFIKKTVATAAAVASVLG